jgi:hypothetical protein
VKSPTDRPLAHKCVGHKDLASEDGVTTWRGSFCRSPVGLLTGNTQESAGNL